MNLVYLVLYVIFGFSCYSRNIKHGYKVIAFVSRFITMEMQDLYVRFWCEIMIDDTSWLVILKNFEAEITVSFTGAIK